MSKSILIDDVSEVEDKGITNNILGQATKEIKLLQKIPAPDRIMGHYLYLLGFRENQVIEDILYCLKMQPSYPAFDSISHCFSDWNFPSQIRTVDLKGFKSIKPYFLCLLTNPVNYVLVLKRDGDSITYMDSTGKLTRLPINELFHHPRIIIIETKVTPDSGKFRDPEKYSLAQPSNIKETLLSIFKVAFHRSEPITYKVFRPISVILTYIFYRLRVRPSMITFVWFSCVFGAAVIISFNTSLKYRLIAAGLILTHYVLDCCDGELARFTKKESQFGHILEQVVHWTTMFSLIVGITIGLYRESHDDKILILGLLCLLFDALFHFSIYYVNMWIKGGRDYRIYGVFSKILNLILPINPNIFFWGLIFNALYIVMVSWTILAAFLFFSLVFSILFAEYKVVRQRATTYRKYIKRS